MLHVCLAGVLLAACAGGSPSSSATAASSTPAATPAAAPLIDIRPITITFGGAPIARLLPDGRTEAVGNLPPGSAMSAGPTLHANGTIQLTKRGLTARISRQGEIYVSNPTEELFGRIDGEHLAFGKNGIHLEGNMMVFDDRRDDVGLIDGPADAGMRRTALVMFAAFLIDLSITP